MNHKKPFSLIDKLDEFFIVVANVSIRYKFWIIVSALCLLVVGGYYLSKVHVDGSINGFFDESDPAYNAYKTYLDDFSSDEITYILYRVPNTEYGPFDFKAMSVIARLTQVLEDEVPFVRKATSLSNVEFMYAQNDDLVVGDLLRDFPNNQQALLAIKQRLMQKPFYINYLINEEANYAAIFLEMDLSSTSPLADLIYDDEKGEAIDNLYPQVSDAKVRAILNQPEFANAGIEFFLAGDVPMNTAYNYLYMNDTSIIVLLTLIIISLCSFLLFKTSLSGLLAPLSVVILSLIMMLGFMGWLGWGAGLFITISPVLISAIGVAQVVHILLEYQRALALNNNKSVAVKAAIKKVGAPCLLAALTTAMGFIVMYGSNIKSLAEFGVYSAMGVIFVFIFSMTLLVVFLSGSKQNNHQPSITITEQQNNHGSLAGINPLVTAIIERVIIINQHYSNIILLVFSAVFIFAFIGLSQLKIDFNFLDEFKPHIEWRKQTELVDKVMGGVMPVTYIIDTNNENGIKDVALLQALDDLQSYINHLPLVKKTSSVTDIIKDINQSFHNNDPSFYRLPDNQALVAQYLLVYEMSGGDELSNVVNIDFSRAVLELRVIMSDASKMHALLKKIDQYLADNPLPNANVNVTGMGLLWVKIADYISATQLVSYSLMFLVIALIMCVTYNSIKLGMLAMIPNLTPVVITLGTMGWLDIHLDYMKLLLATIAIGIATDDTIHLVTRFRSRFYQLGDYQQAASAALRDVGPALVITSIILVAGFSAFLISDLAILADFGLLLAATITIALLADLFLMPALIKTTKPLGNEFSPNS